MIQCCRTLLYVVVAADDVAADDVVADDDVVIIVSTVFGWLEDSYRGTESFNFHKLSVGYRKGTARNDNIVFDVIYTDGEGVEGNTPSFNMYNAGIQ